MVQKAGFRCCPGDQKDLDFLQVVPAAKEGLPAQGFFEVEIVRRLKFTWVVFELLNNFIIIHHKCGDAMLRGPVKAAGRRVIRPHKGHLTVYFT